MSQLWKVVGKDRDGKSDQSTAVPAGHHPLPQIDWAYILELDSAHRTIAFYFYFFPLKVVFKNKILA